MGGISLEGVGMEKNEGGRAFESPPPVPCSPPPTLPLTPRLRLPPRAPLLCPNRAELRRAGQGAGQDLERAGREGQGGTLCGLGGIFSLATGGVFGCSTHPLCQPPPRTTHGPWAPGPAGTFAHDPLVCKVSRGGGAGERRHWARSALDTGGGGCGGVIVGGAVFFSLQRSPHIFSVFAPPPPVRQPYVAKAEAAKAAFAKLTAATAAK